MSVLVLKQHDCNFNFYPEGLSVFAPFKHLRIWVGYIKQSLKFKDHFQGLSRCMQTLRLTRVTGITGVTGMAGITGMTD